MIPCHKCYGPATFIKSQGFTIDESVIFQDNLRAMLLKQNGMAPISLKTKHIRVRYYFIKYMVTVFNIVVKNYTTGEMLAYHFTKPLQGTLFKKLGVEINGIPTIVYDWEMV